MNNQTFRVQFQYFNFKHQDIVQIKKPNYYKNNSNRFYQVKEKQLYRANFSTDIKAINQKNHKLWL